MNQDFAATLIQILPLLLLVVGCYFLLIRPQQKKDKAVKKMLSELKVGDRITTIGGFYATITAIKGDVVTITLGAEKVTAKIARWAIRGLDDTPVSQENDQLI